MATWAKGVDFKNSGNTKRLGGVGIYGTDSTAQKVYLGFGTEPWNNQGLELTASTIKFKGTDVSLSNHNHDSVYAKTSGTYSGLKSGELQVKDIRDTAPTPDSFTGNKISSFFNNHSSYGNLTWQSGITVAGWSTGYQVWQLSAGSSSSDSETLYFRVGRGTAWKSLRKVYHEGFKPSASDVGAAASNHNHDSTYFKKSGDVVTGSATFNGAVTMQNVDILNASIDSATFSNAVTFNDDVSATDIYIRNNPVYHAGRKPTANDIGALSKSGGDITGKLRVGGILESESNSYFYGDMYTSENLEVSKDLLVKKYLKIEAWPGYGSGQAQIWFDAIADAVKLDRHLHSSKSLVCDRTSILKDGFNIPSRDGGQRYGAIINTYGNGSGSYLEIARRNSADTDWHWAGSIKLFHYHAVLPKLETNYGAECLKLKPGEDNHCYIGFYPRSSNRNSRGAWIGYGSDGSNDFWIDNGLGAGVVSLKRIHVHNESKHSNKDGYFTDPWQNTSAAIKAHGNVACNDRMKAWNGWITGTYSMDKSFKMKADTDYMLQQLEDIQLYKFKRIAHDERDTDFIETVNYGMFEDTLPFELTNYSDKDEDDRQIELLSTISMLIGSVQNLNKRIKELEGRN